MTYGYDVSGGSDVAMLEASEAVLVRRSDRSSERAQEALNSLEKTAYKLRYFKLSLNQGLPHNRKALFPLSMYAITPLFSSF